MSDKEVNITYETLFDFIRIEKSREELQDLGETFFQDVNQYLEEKRKILTEEKGTLDNFSIEEKEKTKVQLENIKKILRELYERREKKILSIALYTSREPSTLVNTSVMVEYEKDLFNKTVELLNKYRGEILMSMLYDGPKQEPQKQETEQLPKEQESSSKEEKKKIKLLHAIPKFVGRELEIYGPFESGEIEELPLELANILIDKGKAEEIN